MSSLFTTEPILFNLPDADITYYPSFFEAELATQLYKNLSETIPWQQDRIKVYGKDYAQPRLTALFGNDGKPYSYSNIKMQPHPWTVQLQKIKNSFIKVFFLPSFFLSSLFLPSPLFTSLFLT
jgi:alkylated DNA repair dioxygenase AlkB